MKKGLCKFNLNLERDNAKRERQMECRNKRQFKEALQVVGIVPEDSKDMEHFSTKIKKLAHG